VPTCSRLASCTRIVKARPNDSDVRLGDSAAAQACEADRDAHDDSRDDPDDEWTIGGSPRGDHDCRDRRDRGGDLQPAAIGKATHHAPSLHRGARYGKLWRSNRDHTLRF